MLAGGPLLPKYAGNPFEVTCSSRSAQIVGDNVKQYSDIFEEEVRMWTYEEQASRSQIQHGIVLELEHRSMAGR
jgi:hypothetical protein